MHNVNFARHMTDMEQTITPMKLLSNMYSLRASTCSLIESYVLKHGEDYQPHHTKEFGIRPSRGTQILSVYELKSECRVFSAIDFDDVESLSFKAIYVEKLENGSNCLMVSYRAESGSYSLNVCDPLTDLSLDEIYGIVNSIDYGVK